MTRIASRIALVCALASTFVAADFARPLHAQDGAVDDVKGRILSAEMMQQTFAGGLRHCSELDGTNFYFQPRDRVLSLADYHRSLDNLALQRAFNPETHKPWSQQDADARWAEVQKQAVHDRASCALVASLPDLQKKLLALQQGAAPPADRSATQK